MYYLDPGQFKHPITIKRPLQVKNDDDIPVKSFEILLNTRAKILNTRADEVIKAFGDSVKKTKKFYIRYYKSVEIMENDYIYYKNEVYNIKSINNIEEGNRYLEILGEFNGI